KIGNLGPTPDVTLLTTVAGDEIEGPAVSPLSFGLNGKLLVADEGAGEVNSIDGVGNVVHNVFNWPGNFEPTPEHLAFIPPAPRCTYCGPVGDGFAFFQSSQQAPAGFPSVFAYPDSNFTGLDGGLIVTLEQDQRLALVQFLA